MAPGPGGGDGCASRARTDILSHPRTAGVLEVLAWSPAVQKAAGLLSRSCRNRRETGPGRSRETSARYPLKIDSIF
jgi:hypothetical protein